MRNTRLTNHPNVLKIICIFAFIFQFNQCKCSHRPVYDTVDDVSLKSEEPEVIDLAGLDIENAKGLFAKIPEQNRVYFINAVDGKTYKFTEEEGKLLCRLSGDLGFKFDSGQACAFFVGDVQNPTLHLVTTILTGSFTDINFYTLQGSQWKNESTVKDLLNDIRVFGCTIQADQKLKGCLCFLSSHHFTHAMQLPKLELVGNGLETHEIKIDLTNWNLTTSNQLTGMYQLEVGKVFIGINNSFNLCQLEVKSNGEGEATLIKKDFARSKSTLKGGLFSILDANNIKPTMPIPLFCCSNELPAFYKMGSEGEFFPIDTSFAIPSQILLYLFQMQFI